MAEFQVERLPNPNIEEPIYRTFLTPTTLKYIYGILVVLLAISSLIFFFRRSSFSENNVDIKIKTSSEVASGELATYTISYKNTNQEALNDAVLRFYYPGDAIPVRDGKIVKVINETVNLDKIPGGSEGEQEFMAYIIGDSGNIKNARATLTFVPENVTSTFERGAAASTTITSLAVPLTLVAPPTVINGQTITYIVDYRNQSENDFSDLRLVVKTPDGFQPTKITPQPTGYQYWDIPSLRQNAGSRVSITGNLSGKEGEQKKISVILQKKIITPDGGMYLDFEKAETNSVISSSPLIVSARVNGSDDYSARAGDDLAYVITYKNVTTVDLTGLKLRARLEGTMYDYNSIQSRNGGIFDGQTNTISWDAASVPEFANLRPDQSGTVEFRVRLKPNQDGNSSASNSLVKVTATIETFNVPPNFDINALTSESQLITRVSSGSEQIF